MCCDVLILSRWRVQIILEDGGVFLTPVSRWGYRPQGYNLYFWTSLLGFIIKLSKMYFYSEWGLSLSCRWGGRAPRSQSARGPVAKITRVTLFRKWSLHKAWKTKGLIKNRGLLRNITRRCHFISKHEVAKIPVSCAGLHLHFTSASSGSELVGPHRPRASSCTRATHRCFPSVSVSVYRPVSPEFSESIFHCSSSKISLLLSA